MKSGKPFNKPLAGTLLSMSAPQVAEIISDSGFDWVLDRYGTLFNITGECPECTSDYG